MKKFFSICFLIAILAVSIVSGQSDSTVIQTPSIFTGFIENVNAFINSHIWVVYVLGALFALEQYLASNPKIAANSTFQAISGVFNWIYKFIKPIKK